ncbi:alpha/beta hydrolase [Nannocystaceae bacterium ST9]
MPTGAIVERARLAGLPIEELTPTNAERRVVLQVPGGLHDAHRSLASRLATSCRARVVIPERELTAGAPFLTGIDDLLAVYRAMLRRGTPSEQIVVIGDAAGGDLAIAMLIRARELGLAMPRALVLLSPCMADHPPSELAGLPAMLIQVGERELGEIGRLFERLQLAGLEFELEAYANLRHAGQPFDAMPDAIEAIDRIAAFVDERFALPRLRAVG